MRGGRAVAGKDVKAQLGAGLEGAGSMEHAAVATHLDGLYTPIERSKGIQAPDE